LTGLAIKKPEMGSKNHKLTERTPQKVKTNLRIGEGKSVGREDLKYWSQFGSQQRTSCMTGLLENGENTVETVWRTELKGELVRLGDTQKKGLQEM